MTIESYYYHLFLGMFLIIGIGWLAVEISDRRARRKKAGPTS